MPNYYRSLIILIALIFPYSGAGQSASNIQIYRQEIATVQIHPATKPLSYPVIRLNSTEQILLSFDELGSLTNNYQYTIAHYDANWEKSSLMYSEYLNGFAENQVDDRHSSFNTLQLYTNYHIRFPNKDVSPLISGNYKIIVYEDYSSENAVIEARFSIVETQVGIRGKIERSSLVGENYRSQQVEFSINHTNYLISNPSEELLLVVSQNNQIARSLSGAEAQFMSSNELIFRHNKALSFRGGTEYRYFSCKDIHFQSMNIYQIFFDQQIYHFVLMPDEIKNKSLYAYQEDLNGRFLIDKANSVQMYQDADYVQIHFTLIMPSPLVNGNLYVMGGLNNWQLTDRNKMAYNYQTKRYELTMKVKQGFYNYKYYYDTPESFASSIEGSHYQTENEYLIYVYQRDRSLSYDKLIGFEIIR